MMFGEIVEPSTRALLYDAESEEIHEPLTWEKECTVPKDIQSLLVSDSPFTNTIIRSNLLENDEKKMIAKLSKNIASIYKFSDGKYIILCQSKATFSQGDLIQLLLPWIESSKTTFVITAETSIKYQSSSSREDKPPCFLRSLSSRKDANIEKELDLNCPQLEVPNLVTGTGANVLSYCVHTSRDCCLFVGYVDSAIVDSLNSEPFVKLLVKLGFKGLGVCKLGNRVPENNLYT